MFRLADWPIRRKLGFLTGVGSLVALLLACAAFSVHDVQMIRAAKVKQITALADILGSNATTALEFNDPVTAEEVLSSLRLQPSVEAAALYDAMGELLASYPAPPSDDQPSDERYSEKQAPAECPAVMEATFTDDGYLVIADEIYRDDERVGTVYLRSNLKEIGKQLANVGVIAIAVMTLSLAVAMLITGRLQRLFTAPIQELVEAVKINSVMGGSAQHVKKHGSDEMGVLCDGFNAMVDAIQKAHDELQHANDVLEDRVVERTEELREAREFLETAVAQSPSGILIADAPDVTIQLANRAALDIRGGDRNKLVGIDVTAHAERWQIFFPDGTPYPSEQLPLSRAVLFGEVVEDEELIIRDDQGNDRWINANAAPMHNAQGEITAGIVVFHEITERKKAEAELDKSHQELMKVSRLAGMSEIATGVLHNVGNVLNSVNVAANLIAEKVRKSRVTELQRAGDLVNEHVDDMANFVTEHPQGKHMARYMIEIGKHLGNEQTEMINDLAGLRKNIEHIKEIVSMQQTHARVAGVIEEVSMQNLIEDALRMRSASFDRHQIQIVREYEDIPPIMTDRHKVVQIFVNLVGNAKHAMADNEPKGGTLLLRVFKVDEDRVRFEVTDNGTGISEENLAKVFNFGFTTKKDGHGFGLHTSALAAKELGGALTATSEGKGKGATFSLEIPMHQDACCEVAT